MMNALGAAGNMFSGTILIASCAFVKSGWAITMLLSVSFFLFFMAVLTILDARKTR